MIDPWEEFADSAHDLAPDARLRRLVTVCVSASSLVLETPTTHGELPPGRPAFDLVRTVATGILEEATSDHARVIALVCRNWKRERADPLDELHWRDIDEALELATSTGDRVLLAWVHHAAADQFIITQRAAHALPHAEAAREIVDGTELQGYGPLEAAEPRWRESSDQQALATVLRCHVWNRVAMARRYNGDLAGWKTAIDRHVEVARPALEYRPSLFRSALAAQMIFQRSLEGQADLTELERLRSRSPLFEETFLVQSSQNAVGRGDRVASIHFHTMRIENALRRLEPEHVGESPEKLADLFGRRPEAERRLLNPVANSSYEIALNMSESGRAELYDDDRDLANAWLRLAETIWAGWAQNGLRATRARRATIAFPTEPDAVFDLIAVAREAPRPGLRINVIRRAARFATEHQDAVLEQLDEMLAEPWEPQQRATLLASHSWLNRNATGARGAQAAQDARAALDLIPSRPAGKLNTIAMAETALLTQARMNAQVELERTAHSGAIDAIARLLLNTTTAEQRLRTAKEWAPSIRSALTFAEDHNDADLADLVQEAVRRDGIGTLLSQVSENELAPQSTVKVAKDATVAGRRDVNDLTENTASAHSEAGLDIEGDAANGETLRDAGTVIVIERDDFAYAEAQRILGPLGSLIDPGTLYAAKALTVLESVPRHQPTFLLQLLPSSHDMVGDDGEPRLHRRLTWRDDDGTHEVVDAVPLRAELLEEPLPGDLWIWSDARPLFPEALVNAVLNATPEHPIRLLVVPTKLFHIEFDGLTIGRTFILERALTTVHTSLTAARHALRSTRPWDATAGSFAVFDDEKLPATLAEREALERHFPNVREAETKDEFRAEFQASHPALLAMGVHGSDDAAGWAQTKLLPNGETVSAAEALEYAFPQLCVLASCHSRVRQAGVDHAGFPTAMFARGATTIIGSIGRLYDVATSEILSLFYEELHASGNPVEALRSARLAWIGADPAHRWGARERWARLVAYGGAHY